MTFTKKDEAGRLVERAIRVLSSRQRRDNKTAGLEARQQVNIYLKFEI